MTAARLVLRTAGELALTAGLLVLLFALWLVWWTGRTAAADARADVSGLEREWTAPRAPRPAAAVVATRQPAAGEPFAVLHVPRFGAGWKVPVLQGTGATVLRRGAGHYPSTALPGARGNVGIAGHRTTYGHPFRQVERLRPGDTLVLETAGGWFSYRVTGHRIVQPGRRDLLRSDPGRAELTLTTCHPEYSARQRWIVEAELAGSRGRAAGPPAGI